MGVGRIYTCTTSIRFFTCARCNLASILIAASHGSREDFEHSVKEALNDSFPFELHRRWLEIEHRFSRDPWVEWFVQAIRDIAPIAIDRGLYPNRSVDTLLIDHFGEFRPETVAIVPDSTSHAIRVCRYIDCDEEIEFARLIFTFEDK